MSTGIATLSLAVAFVLAVLAFVHVYWAIGGRWGADAVIPRAKGQPLFAPGPAGTLAIALLLALGSQILAQRGGGGPVLLPDWMARAGAWTIGIVFLLRAMGDFRYAGFFKRVRGSRFADLDTKYFTPLVLVLGACAIVIALS